jgi:OOP family OmpA-OmpF porin
MKAVQITSGNTGSSPLRGGASRKLVTLNWWHFDELHQVILEKNMKRVAKAVGALGLVGFAAMNSQFAVAADSADPWYGGFSIGRSKANIDDGRITSELLGSGLTVTSIDDDKRDTAYKILGGYKFNSNFAVEGGYFNLGEFGFSSTTFPAGTLAGKIKLQGLNLDAVGILPLAENFSAFGRLGLQLARTKDNFDGTGAVAVSNSSPSKSAASYKAGLGVQYDLTESVGLRGEWERYRINDAVGNRGDIDTLSVGLVFRFVEDKPVPQAAAPRVVEVPPVVLVIVPIPPARTQQYCSILDIQFEINRNTVQLESEEKIDTVVTFMRKYPDTTAVIEGHSDEVGTTVDNMILSQRRAENLVSYVASKGIALSRLKAVGFGETRPLADNKTEIGKRLNRRVNAIISCATDLEGLTPKSARLTVALEMEYDVNQADVKSQYREELRKVANFLKANPRVTATVEGHTSNQRGAGAEQAIQLSQRRAQNVVNYLVTNFDIPRSRLSAQGYGVTRRFAYNTSAEGQQENRRVNIILDFPN